MCGITGFINDSMVLMKKRPILTKMMDAIKHRGPIAAVKSLTKMLPSECGG